MTNFAASGSRDRLRLDEISITSSATSPTPAITTGTVATVPVCATTAASVTVNYTTANSPTGTFSAELSDASGSFTTPTALATTASTATSLTVTIPAGTANGTGYKIRVVTPTTMGSASAAFTIVGTATVTIAPTATQAYVAGAAGTQLTATESFTTGTTRAWQVSTTAATGPFANITPAQTGTTYTPTFATAGTYYVRVLSTFTPCGDVASNVVEVDVTPAPTNTISTPTFAATPVCATAAAPLNVTFTATGTFDPANTFAVQLSNAAGSFAAPVTIGTVTNNLTSAQTVSATIPAGTPSGSGYKIQVVADNPAVTSTGTSASLTIVSNPTVSIAPTAPQTVVAGANGTALTATESFTTGTTRVWQFTTTPGGPYTTIAGQTGTSYTPTFASAGTYYVVATSTFAACAAVTSNEVQVTVNNPVPTITSLSPTTAVANSGAFTLTVNGTNFVAGSTVTFNGVGRATTFVSATRLTVAVLAADIATAGTYNVAVTNAAPGGGTTAATAASTFTVTAPGPPTLASYNLTAVRSNDITAPATSTAANVTADNLTRGAGVGTVGSTLGLYGSSSWSSTTLAVAQTNNDYLAFSITPGVGYQANVSSVAANAYRTTAGPQTLELLASTDANFSNPVSLGTQPITSASTTPTLLTFTPSGSTLQNVSAPLYFRLYGYVGTGGNMYLAQSGTTDGVAVYGTVAPVTTPVIYTGTVSPTPACAGSNITVNYTAAGPAAGGTFAVQLSDAAGSFATPVALTTASSTASSITATVPAGTANGTGYRARVVNSDGTVGTASAAFGVQNTSVTVAPTTTQNLNTGVSGATLTATETPAATSRQWYVSTTSGGGYAAISGTTGLTYTPSFATAGTYYVVVQSVFSACGTRTSNEVQFNVSAPTLAATPTSLTGFTASTGSPSQAQTYALTGTGLVSPVTVTAPSGFEVSLDGTTYAASVTAPAPAVMGSAGQPIYVRLTGVSAGAVSGNITNVVGSTSVSVAVSGSVLAAPGALLAEDDFDYNGNLNANGWTGTANSSTIAGNLTDTMYPKGIFALGSTSYQAKVFGASGSAIYRAVAVPTGTTALYAATLLNVSAAQNVSGSDYIFSFRTSGTTSFRGRVTIAKVPSSSPVKYTFKLAAANETATEEATPTQFSVDTNYLMVLKLENSTATGGADKFSLYVLPAGSNLSQEPSAPLLTVTAGNNFSTTNSFNIRETDSNNPTFTLDNFRMATGWGTATGSPVYAAAAAVINAGNYYSVTLNNASTLAPAGAVNLENNLTLTSGLINTSATNSLTLYPGAGVTGGSSTSFVNGPLVRVTPAGISASTAFVFPVGKSGFYRPFTLTLTSQTAASTYIAEQQEGNPNPAGAANILPGNGLGTAPLKRVSKFRAFTLTSSTTTTNNALGTVTLSFGTGDGVNNPADAGLVVAASTGGSAFGNLDRSGSSGTGTGAGGAEVAGTLTSAAFGTAAATATFVLGATNDNNTFGQAINPLPVELTAFSAQRQTGNAVSVAWATASEKNSAYFEVQRSLDGREFATVATATGQGTSNQPKAYAALDEKAPAAQLYYRLRQVDRNGTAAFSPVVTVAGSGLGAKVLPYPNPAQRSIRFSIATATPYRVLNQLGQAVLQGTTEAGIATIMLDELGSGLYFLELQTAAGRVVQKFEKE